LERLCVGTLERWNVCALERWNVGTFVRWNVCALERLHVARWDVAAALRLPRKAGSRARLRSMVARWRNECVSSVVFSGFSAGRRTRRSASLQQIARISEPGARHRTATPLSPFPRL
jgi:hypothetical protein